MSAAEAPPKRPDRDPTEDLATQFAKLTIRSTSATATATPATVEPNATAAIAPDAATPVAPFEAVAPPAATTPAVHVPAMGAAIPVVPAAGALTDIVALATALMSCQRPNDSAALAAHFARETAFKYEPWRATREKYARFIDSTTTSQAPERRQAIIDMAKQHLLSADDVMYVTYSMFGDDRARAVFAATVMQKTGIERIRTHNWFVAQGYGEQWTTDNGEAIERLTLPLFPALPEFRSLNAELLRAGVSGGGSDERGRRLFAAREELYRDPTVTTPAVPASGTTQGGAPFIPVGQDQQGQLVADCDSVARAFETHAALMTDIQRRVEAVERRGQWSRRGRGLAHAQSAPVAPAQNPWRGKARPPTTLNSGSPSPKNF